MRLEVTVVRGDGVGPEKMAAAVEVLQAVCRMYGHELVLREVTAGGEAIERFYNPIPEESLAVCRQVRAVLFGNIGLAKYRNLPIEKRPEYALMRLRREMAVTTNIRPVRLYPQLKALSPLKEALLERGLDYVFVRDIAGGVLCSEKVQGNGVYGREAYEYEYYNEKIVMDTAHIAFRLAESRKKRLISLDKSNVLGSSRLWRRTIVQTGSRYPQVELSHCFVDTAAMRMIATPWDFDVIVTSNLFGDILSDEGTQLTGTPGLYPSAEIGRDGRGIYTPNQLHEPDESLIGTQTVNPIGMILAAALMLRLTFGLEREAQAVEDAVARVIAAGYSTADIRLPGRMKCGTREMGEHIVEYLQN